MDAVSMIPRSEIRSSYVFNILHWYTYFYGENATAYTHTLREVYKNENKVGFKYVIDEGYKYCVTVDGNNKDSVKQVPEFIKLLESWPDFNVEVQQV